MAENLEEILYCTDWDNMLYTLPSKWPMLVDMSYAWINEIKDNPELASHLKRVGSVLKLLMVAAKLGSKFMGKTPYHSGETVSIRTYNGFFLEDAKITTEFIEQYAKTIVESGRINSFFISYAQLIKSGTERKKLAIITSEPTQLIEKIFEYLKITNVPVYGNDFVIEDGVIIGFRGGGKGGKNRKEDGVAQALRDSGASIAYLLDDNPTVVLNIENARAFSLESKRRHIDRVLKRLPQRVAPKQVVTYVDTIKEFLTNY